MKKTMLILTVLTNLILTSTAFASSRTEDCAYAEIKRFLILFKDTIGVNTTSKLDSITNMGKYVCEEITREEGLSVEETKAEVKKAVSRAEIEVFGTDTLQQKVSWQNQALANLLTELRNAFNQKDLEIDEMAGLLETVGKQIFSGPVTLTNGYSCEVSSGISEENGYNKSDIEFKCNNGSISIFKQFHYSKY